MAGQDTATLRETPLHAFHERHGARLVGFAGWRMPVSYPEGTVAEHLHTRRHVSLFDVAHMGAIEVCGPGAAEALERLTPAGVTDLAPNRQRYALLTNEGGGIDDDVMIANTGDGFLVIVNAARREHDLELLRRGLPQIEVRERTDLGLIALQGPAAEAVLAAEDPAVGEMMFMHARLVTVGSAEVWTSRSGYTGEDGFELLVPSERLEEVAERLTTDERVGLAGLGARDTLRLEAGLCLYGSDLDTTTSPVEADLVWTIPKRRRTDGGYPGADRVAAELADGPDRLRVGLRPGGRKPVRAGAALAVLGEPGVSVGTVTSGGWSPSTDGPIAMGYVASPLNRPGQILTADVRGVDVTCEITSLPFMPRHYRR